MYSQTLQATAAPKITVCCSMAVRGPEMTYSRVSANFGVAARRGYASPAEMLAS